ncbi:MAG: ABC transporter permease subunit [Spirochaetaceae bacterium]|nr:ABC transporter permease subunit [Spirochaetaceae bacterium]
MARVRGSPRANRLAKALFQDRYLWLLAVPAVVYYILFHYLPMYGLLIAFKDFSPFLGILRSPWVGFVWFEQFFTSIHFVRTVRNTLLLNFYGFFFNFTVPIIFALLLNEVHNSLFRRWVQTISYIPHFVSIVVVVGLINAMFNTENGLVNTVMGRLGMETVPFLILPGWFRPLYIGSDIWQHFGWRAIIYLAALTAIDQEQYDAAWVDGANRWQQLRFITLPGIAPTIIILMILYVGQMMSVGFEKILLMYGPGTYETADVISTFVYRRGIAGGDYSFAAAAGLFNSVINLVLILMVNRMSRQFTGTSLW